MRLDSIRLQNFQSFADSGEIKLGRLNVFVGKNNFGKSAVLSGIRYLQEGLALPISQVVRVGASAAHVIIEASQIPEGARINPTTPDGRFEIHIERSGGLSVMIAASGRQVTGTNQRQFPGTLPQAVILPLLAERTSRLFDEQVNAQTANLVRADLSNIAAVLSRLVAAGDPRAVSFGEMCIRLFGFNIGVVASQNGLLPGTAVGEDATIAIAAMGTGVVSLVRMLAYLTIARDKVVLIEEPENDLHPEALKFVLKLITEASRVNQILVTTHSHIVLNALGSHDQVKVFRVAMALDGGVPTSTVMEVASPAERLGLLDELGYELTDFGLYDGFLILEESSAESIVERLIGWFTPRLLGRLRTIAAYGVNDVEPRLSDLKRLFVFVDQQPAYLDRAWVMVDGDDAGIRVVNRLKETFPQSDHFLTFDKTDFELFLPEPFAERAGAVINELDVNRRRNQKRALILDVHRWIDEDETRAKAEFEKSASSVIDALRRVEEQMVADRANR